MSGNGRISMRPQGRSPPFLLIGLLVVLCILGFSHWNSSSVSKERASQIVALQEENRSLTSRYHEAVKRSEVSDNRLSQTNGEKDSLQSRLTQSEKSDQDARFQLEEMKKEIESVKSELDSKKETLSQCEQDTNGIQQEVQKLKEERENLKREIADKPAQCDQDACEEPIKNLLSILVNSLDRNLVITALQNGNVEVSKYFPGEPMNQAGQSANNPSNAQQLEAAGQPQGNLPDAGQQPGAVPAANQLPAVPQPNDQLPQQPQQQPGEKADLQQQQQQPAGGVVGQVEPPGQAGGEEAMNKDEGDGEGDEDDQDGLEADQNLKFDAKANEIPNAGIEEEDDAIDQMNANMALNDAKPKLP